MGENLIAPPKKPHTHKPTTTKQNNNTHTIKLKQNTHKNITANSISVNPLSAISRRADETMHFCTDFFYPRRNNTFQYRLVLCENSGAAATHQFVVSSTRGDDFRRLPHLLLLVVLLVVHLENEARVLAQVVHQAQAYVDLKQHTVQLYTTLIWVPLDSFGA